MSIGRDAVKRLDAKARFGRADCWMKVKNPIAPAVRREAEEEWADDTVTPRLCYRWGGALFVLDHFDVSENAAARNRPAFRKLSYHATAEIFVCLYRTSLIAKSICEEGKSNLRWAGPVASKSLFPMLE
jgi:hypothetical protein